MIIRALKYIRYAGEPREWSIVGSNDDYAYFDNLNLLVGKNASGKSRTLNLIRQIANLFSGQISLKQTVSPSENFEIIFTEGENTYKYILGFKNRTIITEVLMFDDKVLLDREKKIFIDLENNRLEADVSDNQLAITLQNNEEKSY